MVGVGTEPYKGHATAAKYNMSLLLHQAWKFALFVGGLESLETLAKCDSGKGETEEIRSEKFRKRCLLRKLIVDAAPGCKAQGSGECSWKQGKHLEV